LNAAHRLLRVLLYGAVAVGVLLPAGAAYADPVQDLERQIAQAHIQIEKIVEEYNGITEEIAQTQAATTALTERLAPLQGQLDAARAGVTALALRAYKTGSDLSTANILLSANSTTTLARQMTSLDRIARVRQREIAGYAETKTRYEQEKRRLDALVVQQNAQQQQLAARKATIETDIKRLEDLQRRAELAARSANRPRAAVPAPAAAPAPPPPAAGSGRGAVAVQFAYAQLGKPYRWAGVGPGSYDCSGLTMASWRAAGVSLPHNAAMQWRAVHHISRGSLQPGDLVFYYGLGHVAIYIGNWKVIHAPHSGDVVRVASVDMASPYGYGRP
jgi:cell wall-associated NlpC family hydrolase